MNVKTMEGLAGARANINLANVPMRVYRDAKRRGDTAVMERALGYAGDFSGKAEEYQKKADEGMKEEALEAREKQKAQRERAIENRREEREKSKERIEENKTGDKVEVSEEGRAILEEQENCGSIYTSGGRIGLDKEPIIYTSTGEVESAVKAYENANTYSKSSMG